MATRGLKDYLQRYVDAPPNRADGGKTKKAKKSKGKAATGGGNAGSGVIIVDNDASWHRELKEEDEDEPDEEGEAPQVIEDVEVKRMHRMEALKTHRPYLSMANDGSGWVTVKDDEKAGGGDNSAPRSPSEVRSLDFSAKRKRSDSPDLSPPRRRDSPHLSSPRRRNDSPDSSPPRRRRDSMDSSLPQRRIDSPDISPPRRRKGSPDISAPRRRRDSPDSSPPTRLDSPQVKPSSLSMQRKRMDSFDLSPPRRRKLSPDVAYGKKNSIPSQDSDPPRRSKFSAGVPSLNPRDSSPRRRKDSIDLSPPRRRHDSPMGESRDTSTKRKGGNSPDLSAPRRINGSVDLSPPRRSKFSTGNSRLGHRDPPQRRNDSPDLSPPRRRKHSPEVPSARTRENRASPPRKPQNRMASSMQNRSQDSSPPPSKSSARMSDGAYGGLKSNRENVSEVERKRAAEAKMVSELDPSLSGRGVETVFRDKRGRRLEGLEEMLRQQRGEVKPVEQPLEWGKGLAQKKKAEANFAELEAEKSRPFARYRDDAELDKSLKERLRWGDPMAHLVKQNNSEPVLEDLGAREEMKASGFVVPQDIPKHSWLKRGMAPPPNRYDIRPGRHWDGVDRSTGYEQGLFKSKNEKKARDLEAYLWSVSDM